MTWTTIFIIAGLMLVGEWAALLTFRGIRWAINRTGKRQSNRWVWTAHHETADETPATDHKAEAENLRRQLAEANGFVSRWKELHRREAEKCERAERSLMKAGFTDNGGEEWKPPVNTENGEGWRQFFELEKKYEVVQHQLSAAKRALADDQRLICQIAGLLGIDSTPPIYEVDLMDRLGEIVKHKQQISQGYAGAIADREAASDRAAKLQAFKDYVHKRLDEAGVPADPWPEQTKTTGCRIKGRLDTLIAHAATSLAKGSA